jgi:trk system potassium uptake protein TrkA
MQILIVGAGNTGCNVAEKFCEMGHDVVVVDRSPEALAAVDAHLDILTVTGSGSSPDVLEKAQVAKADLLIAVTNLDEVNLLACQYGHAAGVSETVARVVNPALTRTPWLDFNRLGVNMIISQNEEVGNQLLDMLRNPGLLESVDLFGGRVFVTRIRLQAESPLQGCALSAFSPEGLISRVRFIAAMRGDTFRLPRGNTTFEIGDDLYTVVRAEDVGAFLDWADPGRQPFEKCVIAGGGGIGLGLVMRMETLGMSAVLLERDVNRAEECSDALRKTLVLHGDASDQETLVAAGVRPGTAFVAITGDEELNIISCALARKLGATFTVAQVGKPEYVPIIRDLNLLDRVVSPHFCMVNAILRFARGQHVKAAMRLQEAPGELLQVVVGPKHRWVGKAIRNLKIPGDCLIATVLRDEQVHVPTGDLVLHGGDQLVLFAMPDGVDRVQAAFKS